MKKILKIISMHYPQSNFFLCDIGARDGISHRWQFLEKRLKSISFEPDPKEYKRLKDAGHLVFKYALGEREESATLNITSNAGCSSLLTPNVNFLSRFPESERFNIEKTEILNMHKLDQIYTDESLQRLDFVKIDVQGFELSVLKGSFRLLEKTVLGMEIEVEFGKMYIGQPLFRDVDAYIAETENFEILDIRKTYWKEKGTEYIGSHKGQLIFGDALYFRTLDSLFDILKEKTSNGRDELIIAYILMCLSYGYIDRIIVLLQKCSTQKYLSDAFIQELTSVILKTEKRSPTPPLLYKLYNILKFASLYFLPTHKGWAIADRNLGSEKRLKNWWI